MTVPTPSEGTLIRWAPEMFELLYRLETHMQVKTGKRGAAHAEEGHEIRTQIKALLKEMEREV